jgi:DNA polymerase gamma 1
MFSTQLGMNDLPEAVAFFSLVDVDHVLRKEVDMDCITPSHPQPIPPGQSLSIHELLALTGGHLGPTSGEWPLRDHTSTPRDYTSTTAHIELQAQTTKKAVKHMLYPQQQTTIQLLSEEEWSKMRLN